MAEGRFVAMSRRANSIRMELHKLRDDLEKVVKEDGLEGSADFAGATRMLDDASKTLGGAARSIQNVKKA